jgi:hypothetical protein
MSDNIIQLNQELIHNELKDLVRNSIEETLNALLDREAEELVNGDRKGYRSGHYSRNFQTTAGEVKLKMPKLKSVFLCLLLLFHRYRGESQIACVSDGTVHIIRHMSPIDIWRHLCRESVWLFIHRQIIGK